MLIFYNAWYVLCPAPSLRLRLPALWTLLLVGAVLGVVQGFFLLFSFTLFQTPLAVGGVPFDVIFFYAGCVAARDDWLADLALWSKGQLAALYAVAATWLVAICAGTATFLSAYPPNPACEAGLLASGASAEWPSGDWPAAPPPPPAPSVAYTLTSNVLFFGAFFGIFTVAFSLALLHFSSVFFNFTGPRCDFFSQAAYGVYVSHFVFIGPIQYAWISIMRAAGETMQFSYCSLFVYDTSALSGSQLCVGFFFVAGVLNLILWPLAYAVRKLPGFSRVL